MINKIKTVIGRVKYILKYSKKARDNDTFLYFLFLEKFYNLSESIGIENAKIVLRIMNDAPNPESIRRSRQKLQELGYFPGNKKLKKLMADDLRIKINEME
jgi:hypothetical protein